MPTKKEEATSNKARVIWEAIRRTPEYQSLHAAYIKAKKAFKRNPSEKNRQKVVDISINILKDFRISTITDPKKEVTEKDMYFLEREFFGQILRFDHSMYLHTCNCPDRQIEFRFFADMNKSASAIASEFNDLIKNIKRARLEKGFDEIPKMVIGGKERPHDYDPMDFDFYDFVNQFRKKNKRAAFYNIAKALFENPDLAPKLTLSGKNAIVKKEGYSISVFYDRLGKAVENAYNRAKWCVNGGYRTLM